MTLCTYLLSVAIPKCPIAALKQKIKGVRYEYGVDCSDCSVIDDDCLHNHRSYFSLVRVPGCWFFPIDTNRLFL